MTLSRAKKQLEIFTQKAQVDPQTRLWAAKHDLNSDQKLAEVKSSIEFYLDHCPSNHDCNLPFLTEAVLGWASNDPDGYAEFICRISKSHERQLTTLGGLWRLQQTLNSFSEGHPYVLQDKEGVFFLQDLSVENSSVKDLKDAKSAVKDCSSEISVKNVNHAPIVHPTSLALSIVHYRKMALPDVAICPMSRA